MVQRALLLSGHGRYADPWHPFAETSAALAEVVTAAGPEVEVCEDVDAGLERVGEFDLLVVNTGDPWRNGETGRGAPTESVTALAEALERGLAVLAVHTAITSLRDHPVWAAATGAVWLPELSGHPPLDEFTVRLRPHPLLAGQSDFTVTDEQYSFLQRVGDSTVLAEHSHAGEQHPLVWIREHGRSRVAVDLLGHDQRAYASAEHRRLLATLIGWVLPTTD